MPPFARPTAALRASQSLLRAHPQTASRQSIIGTPALAFPPHRHLTSTPSSRMADHGGHESHYEPPHGWLWGIPPGEKYQKEGWETLWYWGFYGSLVVAVFADAWKPDTSIETWALEEAKRRLQAEGVLPEEDE